MATITLYKDKINGIGNSIIKITSESDSSISVTGRSDLIIKNGEY